MKKQSTPYFFQHHVHATQKTLGSAKKQKKPKNRYSFWTSMPQKNAAIRRCTAAHILFFAPLGRFPSTKLAITSEATIIIMNKEYFFNPLLVFLSTSTKSCRRFWPFRQTPRGSRAPSPAPAKKRRAIALIFPCRSRQGRVRQGKSCDIIRLGRSLHAGAALLPPRNNLTAGRRLHSLCEVFLRRAAQIMHKTRGLLRTPFRRRASGYGPSRCAT